MRIPLAFGGGAVIISAAVCITAILVLFVIIHEGEMNKAATDGIVASLQYARLEVQQPLQVLPPLLRAAADQMLHFSAYCNDETFGSDDVAMLSSTSFTIMDVANSNVIYMYQMYRRNASLDAPSTDSPVVHPLSRNSRWGECGCTRPFNETTNPDAYCWLQLPEEEVSTIGIVTAHRNASQNAEIVGKEAYDTTSADFTQYAMTLSRVDGRGLWGPNGFYLDTQGLGLKFYMTYYLPFRFGRDGEAVSIVAADVSLRWMRGLLEALQLPETTQTTVIRSKDDQISATTYPIPLYHIPNASTPEVGITAWRTEASPSRELTSAVRHVKARIADGAWTSIEEAEVFTDHSDVMLGVQPVVDAGLDLVILMSVHRDVYFAEGIRARNGAVALGVVGFLVVSLASVMVTIWVTRPLKVMGGDMQDAAMLDCDVKHLEARPLSVISEVASLQCSFLKMNYHLMSAKPYLPEVLFDGQPPESESDLEVSPISRVPPGLTLDEQRATVVFTDIVGSTTLWQTVPDDMRAALKLHDRIIRQLIVVHHGYEVKTIGDAFMVAFPAPANGLQFSLDVHKQFLVNPWPAGILDTLPRDAEGLWGGLILRIGMQDGPVSIERSRVTRLYDYFGTTVNQAARLEAACPHGMICLTEELLKELESESSIGDYVVQPMGNMAMKGFADPVTCCCLASPELAGRSQKRWSLLRQASLPEHQAARREEEHDHRAHFRFAQAGCLDSLRRVSSASVACVAIPCEIHILMETYSTLGCAKGLNYAVQSIKTALDRTNGSLVTLAGTYVMAAWNTSTVCVDHNWESLRFAGILQHDRGCGFICGVSTGMCVHGGVGPSAHRFVTVAGPCVRLARVLMDAACDEDVSCLFASFGPCPYGSLTRTLSRHAIWEILHNADDAVSAINVSDHERGSYGAFGRNPLSPLSVSSKNKSQSDAISTTSRATGASATERERLRPSDKADVMSSPSTPDTEMDPMAIEGTEVAPLRSPAVGSRTLVQVYVVAPDGFERWVELSTTLWERGDQGGEVGTSKVEDVGSSTISRMIRLL